MSEGPGPFVPLPVVGREPPTTTPKVQVVYVRYRAPDPLEFPGVGGILPGPIFHVAGVLLREDSEFLALGEVAFAPDNPDYVARFGRNLFPAFRHILTIPKASVLQRQDFWVSEAGENATSLVPRPEPGPDRTKDENANWTNEKL
jgi:hypothetical protein